jgi:hypothetical protein
VGGAVGSFLGCFVSVFGWGLLLWLIGRFVLRGQLDFMRAVEVAGLASAISALDTLIRLLLALVSSNPLAAPSLAMFMKDPDPSGLLYSLLSLANIMTFWVLAVRSVGLAKLAGVGFSRAAVWVFGCWGVLMGLLIGLGQALQKVFGGLAG